MFKISGHQQNDYSFISIISNPNTILSSTLPATGFTTVDLCFVCFQEASRPGPLVLPLPSPEQSCPRGSLKPCCHISQALNQDLKDLNSPCDSLPIQYVNDLLYSENKEAREKKATCSALAEKSHKVSKENFKFCQFIINS